MKKQSPESAQAQAAPKKKLVAIGLTIDDAEINVTDEAASAQRVAKKNQQLKQATAASPSYSVDKRREARKEHTNHFTNRAPSESK